MKTWEVLVKVEYHGQVWFEVKQITTGIKPGELVLITAHENVGKTHVTNNRREYEGYNPSKVVSRSTDETNSL